jgi:hypothetical protein
MYQQFNTAISVTLGKSVRKNWKIKLETKSIETKVKNAKKEKGEQECLPFNMLACSALFEVRLPHTGFRPHPLIHLPLRLVFGDPVLFLDLSDELFVLAVDDVDIIIGQFTPTLLN